MRSTLIICLLAGLLATATHSVYAERLRATKSTVSPVSLQKKPVTERLQTLRRLARARIDKIRARHEQKLALNEYTTITIDTPYGTLTGLDNGNVTQFLGVPYAAKPIGNLRWKDAQDVPYWGNYSATYWGTVCPQTDDIWHLLPPTTAGEDCLYLNIYMPSLTTRKAPAGGWPIMQFFYGGSWDYGSGSFLLYDGNNDVTMVEDIVLVTINYRLNVLGWLASPELQAESPSGSVGNYGLTDQRQSLHFIRNISSAINANPNSITIFGESAGSGSVTNHLASPKSWGLFQRAIGESGPAADWSSQPLNISSLKYDALVTMVNCANSNPATELACLRALPWQLLQNITESLPTGMLEWSPVVDGVNVLDEPQKLFAAGKIAPNVTAMYGSNKDEGTLFVPFPYDLTPQQYADALVKFLGPTLGPAAEQLYPLTTCDDAWWCVAHLVGESMINCPSRRTARWLSAPTRNGGAMPAYLYFFDYTWFLTQYVIEPLEKERLGCFHGSELVAVFDTELALLGSGEKDLAALFVRYWTRFAITGNPNGKNPATGLPDPFWDMYNTDADVTAVLGMNTTVPTLTPTAGLYAQNCAFWDENPIPPQYIFGHGN